MALQPGDIAFTGRIPELYERFLVPLIFRDYAEDLAGRALAAAPGSILEIGCGTGVLTRALAAGLARNQRLLATDLNAAMLEEARRILGDHPEIAWQTADASALPFEEGAFDLALCQYTVMFFPDKVAAYREIRRVLKPGRPFLFNTWDRLETSPIAELATEAACAAFPDDPPLFLKRTPYGYFDPEVVRRDLEQAGFREIEIEPREEVSRAETAQAAAFAFVQCTPLRGEIEARDPGRLDPITEAAAKTIAERYGEPVEAPIRAYVVRAA